MATAKASDCEIILPVDLVAAKEFKPNAEHKTVDLEHIPAEGWELLDIGEKSIAQINAKLEECKTLVWNGPLGVFEMKPFDNATNKVAQKAAELTAAGKLTSVAGGGDFLWLPILFFRFALFVRLHEVIPFRRGYFYCIREDGRLQGRDAGNL